MGSRHTPGRETNDEAIKVLLLKLRRPITNQSVVPRMYDNRVQYSACVCVCETTYITGSIGGRRDIRVISNDHPNMPDR